MKPLIRVAMPHEDILKGKLTMDVFAADLWQVATGGAPQDYQDEYIFFRKTYPTKGLRNILEVARNRLEGKTGDSVIQLQTPFGGGKTHALIALYHKAKEWNAKVVVFDGAAFNPRETKPWEELERQLTGKVEVTKGDSSPGRQKLIKLLSENTPVLILMDEILQYATKAATVKVGDSNLASQTLAFIQELTGAVSAVGRAMLVLTLPSSILEHYDEYAEKLYNQIQKITGRMEKIYTPVSDDEIEDVIRKRLFQKIDEDEVRRIVNEFVEYARSEGLLSGEDAARYRQRFMRSYPFKPEVIDILHKRWGSFPTFQRTRGVLRLLSLVIYDLMYKNIPFIRLGDFNLKKDEIKIELIKHIGPEYDSIIAQDITAEDSAAKRVDVNLGDAYKPYKLGTVVSTTIFMMSFSGKSEKGCTIREVKLSSTYPDFSSSIIDTVINQLKERLFYLSDEGLYFTNRPNINKILITREENVTPNEIIEYERRLLEKHLSKKNLKLGIYIWPRDHRDIPDNEYLKLIILKEPKPDRSFIEKHGETPRVYRNTMLFLCIDPAQQEAFYRFVRRSLALRSIETDSTLNLTVNQKREIKDKIKSSEERTYEELRRYYRKVYLPTKDYFKEIDLGIPTYGMETYIDSEVYKALRTQGEILEKLSPITIKEKYLSGREYVETKKILDAFMKTPGEIRITSSNVLRESIKEGVKEGLFGFGRIENGVPKCSHIKETVSPTLEDYEIITRPELYEKPEEPSKEGPKGEAKIETPATGTGTQISGAEHIQEYKRIYLKLNTPLGRISDIARIINYLKTIFNKCTVKVEIDASNGKIKVTDYENKIEEALKQAGIKIEEQDRSPEETT